MPNWPLPGAGSVGSRRVYAELTIGMGVSVSRIAIEKELDAIAKKLNNRPRQTLNRMTPSEKFLEVVATTG